MFDLKSKHAFGSEADIDIALEQGLIDAYDILYLDEKKIGWIDRDGNKVIVDNSVPAEIGESIAKNSEDISALKEENSAITEEVSALKEGVSAFGEDISELKEQASTAGEEISGLKEQMSTATENISDMNEKISSVEEDIVKLNEDMQNAGAVASVNGQTGEVELSYDDLKDKPFGETVQIPHALNVESMDGLESFTATHTYEGVNEEVIFYKAADIVPEPSAIDWTNSYYGVDMSQEGTDCWYTYPDGTPALIVARATEISAVPYNNNEIFSVPSAGIWTSAADYVNGLVCTVEEVTKLSDEFIPDSIARKEDIPEAFEASVSSVNGKTGAVELAYEDLKDKPFGEEVANTIVIPETTVTQDANYGVYHKFGDESAFLKQASTYIFTLDGIKYECYCDYDSIGGHISIKWIDSEDKYNAWDDLSFYIYNETSDGCLWIYILGAGDHTYTLEEVSVSVKTLDEKFIPDTIARVSDIPEVPEHTWESLPDKPFGEEEAAVATLFEGTRSLDWYGSDFQSSGGINGGLTIELGKNYLITVNPDGFGTYTCVYDCTSTTRLSCYVTSVNDSSDGFWFEVDCGTGTIFIGISNPDNLGNISTNILIEELGTVIDPLDAKYLPMSDIIEAVKQSFTDVSQEGA